jgi:hypothetical protein
MTGAFYAAVAVFLSPLLADMQRQVIECGVSPAKSGTSCANKKLAYTSPFLLSPKTP